MFEFAGLGCSVPASSYQESGTTNNLLSLLNVFVMGQKRLSSF